VQQVTVTGSTTDRPQPPKRADHPHTARLKQFAGDVKTFIDAAEQADREGLLGEHREALMNAVAEAKLWLSLQPISLQPALKIPHNKG
jgi:hypothetical protein